jgi:hypothetical protein
MKRLHVILIAALVATVVGVVAVTAGQANSPGERTIRLVEKRGSFTFVDNQPTGNARTKLISAGDFSAGTVPLDDQSGKQAGSLQIVCVATVSGKEVHATFQCNGTIRLADGTLAISALQRRHPDQDATQISVVGGTGAYQGARGSVVQTPRPSAGNITDDEIHLIP